MPMKTTLQSIRMLIALTLLTGILYPVAMTGIAQTLFAWQANGSRAVVNRKAIGSDLLAQKFESPRYFWPRPSAADYATIPSGASNKGPTSVDLVKAIEGRRQKFGSDAPGDLLTASGSGLDPDISPQAARAQIARISAERNQPSEKISALIIRTRERPQFGFLGEPRVNVLRLNLALDQLR